MINKISAVLLLSVTLISCGYKPNDAESLLVNGDVVDSSQAPSSFYIFFDPGYSCTATKIAKGTILTAGHCIHGTGLNGGLWFSNDTVVNRNSMSKLRKVSRPVVTASSENCSATNECQIMQTEDIGIYYVAEEGDFAKLPVTSVDFRPVQVNEQLLSFGYGCESGADAVAASRGEPNRKPNRRKMGAMRVSALTSLYVRSYAAYNSVQTCPGDSGGPLFRHQGGKLSVVGILSNGIAYRESNYVRLSALSQFLNTHLNLPNSHADEPVPTTPEVIQNNVTLQSIEPTAYKFTTDSVQGVPEFSGQWCTVPFGTKLHVKVLEKSRSGHIKIKMLSLSHDLPKCTIKDTEGILYAPHFKSSAI